MRHGNARTGVSQEKAAKGNRKRRAKLRKLGLRPMQVWVLPEQRVLVREFVANLGNDAGDDDGE